MLYFSYSSPKRRVDVGGDSRADDPGRLFMVFRRGERANGLPLPRHAGHFAADGAMLLLRRGYFALH